MVPSVCSSLRRMVAVVSIALLSGALAACAAFEDLRNKASLLAGSLTGLRCLVSSVGPCFPCGLRACDITLYSVSGVRLFQAKELHSQLNLLSYLQRDRKTTDLFETVHGDQVTLTLVRNERGEWEFPRLLTSQRIRVGGEEAKGPPRRLSFTNVTIIVKTAAGEASRFYKKLEANVDPARQTVQLKLTGVGESAMLTVTRGVVKRYELQADNFAPAFLAPVAASSLPLGNLLIHGTVTATTRDDATFLIDGTGTIATHGLRSPIVSSGTIDGLNLSFDLKGTLTGSGIDNVAGKIGLGKETVLITGGVRGWEKPVVDLTATFLDFSYDRAFSALPVSLHPDLPVIRLAGSMTGSFRMHLDTADPRSLDCSYSGRLDPLQVLNVGQGIDMERLKGPFLHKVRIRPEAAASILLDPANPDFTPYHKIPFSLRSAVMAAEDNGFLSHKGFSTSHIRGALIENMKAGRVVRGASTISMQLAKNLFLSPERTLSRKLEEALITVALEQHLDKRRIMEIYLNIIEWGDGIYGIGPAARYYFGKRPAELSPVEAAFLASIIPRPRIWRPDPLSRLSNGWRQYLRVILYKMYQSGAADLDDMIEVGAYEAKSGSQRGYQVG